MVVHAGSRIDSNFTNSVESSVQLLFTILPFYLPQGRYFTVTIHLRALCLALFPLDDQCAGSRSKRSDTLGENLLPHFVFG